MGKDFVFKFSERETFEKEKEIYEAIKDFKEIILESSFISSGSFYLIKQKKAQILGYQEGKSWKLRNTLYTKEIIEGLARILVSLNKAKVNVFDLDHSFTFSDIGYYSGHWRLIDFDFSLFSKMEKPKKVSKLISFFDTDWSDIEKDCHPDLRKNDFNHIKDKDISNLSKLIYEKICTQS